MKRTIALLLILAMALSMAACKDEFVHPTSPNATADSTPPVKEPLYLRDSYTVTDQQAQSMAGNVVATIGDTQLTNGLFHAYYWMAVRSFMEEYGDDSVYYGLNYTKPLDQQPQSADGSWQHYFISDALQVWHRYQAMALMAQRQGVPMNEAMSKELEGLYQSLEASLEKSGYDDVGSLIQGQMGAGCSYQDYYDYTEIFYLGYSYYEHMVSQLDITQAQIDAYFTENQEKLEKQGIKKDAGNAYAVRHILISIEGGTRDDEGNTVYSDADWETCRAKAQSLLDQWLAGDASEDSFAALANEHSDDTGSNTAGGLYEGLTEDAGYVEPFKEWYLAQGRQVGDYGLVKTDFGYHVMYLSGVEESWIYHCRSILTENALAELINEAILAFPAEIDYESIGLSTVTLVAER